MDDNITSGVNNFLLNPGAGLDNQIIVRTEYDYKTKEFTQELSVGFPIRNHLERQTTVHIKLGKILTPEMLRAAADTLEIGLRQIKEMDTIIAAENIIKRGKQSHEDDQPEVARKYLQGIGWLQPDRPQTRKDNISDVPF